MITQGKNIIREKGAKEFSILFAGDFCVGSETTLELLKNGKASEIVKNIKPLFDSTDINVLQWETVCGMEGEPIRKSGPNLHNPEFCMDFAKALGIDVTLLANNHTGDFGPEMALVTRDRLEAAGFKTVGIGKDIPDARKPLIIEQNGLKIAILNFCENEFGTAKVNAAGTNPYGVVAIANSIREAKKTADFVVLTMHGGHEYNPYPSPRMTEEFRFYASCGANLIFNCHTHCPEGMEVVDGVPVVYSPGNFFFTKDKEMGGSPEADRVWRSGYIPKFYCDENGVYAFEITPYSFTNSDITPLSGAEKDGFIAYINKISAPIADAALLKKYFDGWSYQRGFLGYLNSIRQGLPENELAQEDISYGTQYYAVRNIFTCESHNDMIRNTMRIIEEKRLDECKRVYQEDIIPNMTFDF